MAHKVCRSCSCIGPYSADTVASYVSATQGTCCSSQPSGLPSDGCHWWQGCVPQVQCIHPQTLSHLSLEALQAFQDTVEGPLALISAAWPCAGLM